MRRNGRQGRLFATVTLGLAGCLSFPEASPCTADTDCAGADRCDVAAGRCVPRGTAGDPDAGGGGATGGTTGGSTGGNTGGNTGGSSGGTTGGSTGGDPGGAGGDGGAGGEPVPGRRWRFVSAGGAEPYRATSRGYVTIDGGSHTCALTGDDRLFCWGANMDGQLGTADPTPRVATPVEVDPAARWRTVSAGAAHTCAIRADGPDAGRLYCWGEPEHGRLGLGDPGLVATVAPRPVGNERDWEAVSAGGAHTCGLRAGGLLFCWGANEYGQVGTGALETPSFRTPQQVGDPGFTQVSAGLAHTCALRDDRTVQCWGAADLGQVGAGRTQTCAGGDVCAATPRMIEDLPPDVRQIAAGEAHACALDDAGDVYCWGASFEGAFAADVDITPTPVVMNIDTPIRHFDAGGANTCVTTADFSVCFGEGRSGQRGNGFPDDPAAAGALPPLDAGHYTQFSIGGEHVCAITSGGALHCFGSQSDGQLGQGVFSGVTVPTPVAFEDASARVVKVAAAHEDTACALVAGVDAAVSRGDIHCWGDGVEDQLLGQGGPRSAVPVQLTRTGDYVDLAVGERFGCALTENRQVRCWGRGDRGQLGNGFEQGSRGMLVDADVSMAGLSEARLVAGTFHACLVGTVITELESVTMAMCWGFNPEGQLGPDASNAGPWGPLPLQAGELGVRAVVQDVALGTTRTFGIAPNGQLVAWGGVRNLFDGTYANRERALSSQYTFDDPDPAPWVRIRAHMDRLCGLRRDGLNGPRIFCADVYAADQAEERGRALDLRAFPDRTPWADVVVGDNVGCGLGSDGRLFCAGYNHFGQLGDGHRSSLEAEQMTQVGGNTLRFHQVAAGAGFMCGVRRADDQPAEDRRLYCWGRGHRGQTGLGVADVSRPVPVPLPDP